jgi:acyl dehydratase
MSSRKTALDAAPVGERQPDMTQQGSSGAVTAERAKADSGRVKIASYGRYLEEFEVGDIYEHRPGRTITDADNIQFSLMTMNAHPMHCDSAFAAKSEFGKPLVNSGLSLAVVLGMTVNDVSYKAIANLGWSEIKLTAPVHPGDTLYARSEVLEVRESKSRPTQGIVTTRTEGYNQDGVVVMRFTRMSLIPKRGYGVGD